MTSRCNRFFHIIPRKSSITLKIPDNFTRRFGGALANPIFLKPPDGTEWKVYWTKNECEIWFQKGWADFATYYSLDYGHLVLFEYEGTSHFEVHICDMSALEIEYPFHNQIHDDSIEILSEKYPCKKKRLKSPISSPEPHRTEIESSPNVQNMLHNAQIEVTHSEGTHFEMPIIASLKQEFDDGKSTKRTSLLISPCPEISGNMKEAKKFTSENPFFMINIRQCHLEKTCQSRPSISTFFVRKYFKAKKKQSVMIKFGKKSWPAKVNYYRCSAKFSVGWSDFAKESKLHAGDVCIFELINIEDAVLAVHIFSGHNN